MQKNLQYLSLEFSDAVTFGAANAKFSLHLALAFPNAAIFGSDSEPSSLSLINWSLLVAVAIVVFTPWGKQIFPFHPSFSVFCVCDMGLSFCSNDLFFDVLYESYEKQLKGFCLDDLKLKD